MTTSLSGFQIARRRRRAGATLARCLAALAGIVCLLLAGAVEAGSLDVEWDAPTTNADGTPLTDLFAYRVYAAPTVPACPGPGFHQVFTPNSHPVAGDAFGVSLGSLSAGLTYWVRISALDFSGNESSCTDAVSGVARSDLAVAPAALDFATVDIATTATLDVTVQNVGVAALTGTATVGVPFSIVTGGALSLAPGARQTVRVRFAPRTVQTFVGNVTIATSRESASLIVRGEGITATPAVLQLAQSAVTVPEGGTATLTVTRTGGTHGGVTVQYATGDGTAVAGADYVATAGTLSFAAGQMSQTFALTTRQDTEAEGPETLGVTLSNPAGGAILGARSAATVTITDDEPNVQFTAATYAAAETAGAVTITVSRAGSAAALVTVGYATGPGGTATPGPGGDYTPVSGTLTFAPGQTSRSFTVPILDDDVADGPKTVVLRLANPTGAALGAPSVATLTIADSDVAGTIQFGAAQYTADEGGGVVTVSVIRSGGTAAGASAVYTVTGGTATAGLDFTMGGTGTVTFPRGVSSVAIPIPLTSDALLEGVETLELTLSDPAGGATLGAVRQTVVALDETAFQFTPAVYTVAEGGVATITVARTGPSGRAATVDWATGDGTATANLDYAPGAGTLTFAPGVRSRTLTVATREDALAEGPETVLLTLRNPSAGAIRGAQRTAVLTITDNDSGGAVHFGAAAYTLSERAGTFAVPVLRTGGLAGPVTIDYTIGGAGGGTLTFAAGQTSTSIPLTITDDASVEADEAIVLELSHPTAGAVLGTPSRATVTVTDNDRSGTLQLGAATYTAVEGTGTATVTIVRTGSTASPVSVRLTTADGTAIAGADYTAVSVPVTFGVGVTSRTVAIPLLPNAIADGPRTVMLALSEATSPAALGTPSTAVLTIVDDDAVLELGAAAYSVAEGGTATITVRRTGSALGTVSVGYTAAGGTASAGTDYTAASGRLTFGPGVTTQTFTVRPLADNAAEGDETITLTLAAPTGQATVGALATATLTVLDNPPVVKFGASSYVVTEGTPTALVTVVRTGPSGGTVTVDYARNGGTATGFGVDYSLSSGTLTFGPGVMTRTVSVAITNDTLIESAQTVVLRLGNVRGSAMLGTPSVATLTIQDNEPQVRFSSATYSMTESAAAVTLTLLRSGPTTLPLMVDIAQLGGTATAGADYAFTAGTLTFPPGVTSRTVTVPIVNDGLAEAPETVVFGLSRAINASIGSPSTATVTLVDDEPQVRFAAASYTATEGGGPITVTVLRAGPVTGTVTVDYAATGGTASSAQDYVISGTGTLTFGPGVTTRSFTVAVTDDTVVEAAETIVLELGNPTGATLGPPAVATVNVGSNDVAGTLRFASPVFTQDEGAAEAVVTVTRQGGLASAVTVEVATLDGSAQAGIHYTAVAGTVTFAAGQASASFAVPLLDNGVPEPGRWLGLVLSAPAGGATLGSPAQATLWIVDDD